MIAYITANWAWIGGLIYVVVNEIIAGSPLKANSNVQVIWTWLSYLLPKPAAPATVVPPPVA